MQQLQDTKCQHVFLVGAKSVGAYGGFETFVDKLTEYHQYNNKIKYHIACKANGEGFMDEKKLQKVIRYSDSDFLFHNAHCFKIFTPNIGPAAGIFYDLKALHFCCKFIKENKIKNSIIYIMACRIGPFAAHYKRLIHRLGGEIWLNPDGHEFLRQKWSYFVRKYWKISEKMMIKHSDLIICDSINIEQYIHETYDNNFFSSNNPKTIYIAYGAETRKSMLPDNSPTYIEWMRQKEVVPKSYYLIVGRFVPENNYDIIIREYLKSHTQRDLIIITTANKAFMEKLECKYHFGSESKIKFVGTVYDQELLMKIRENAYGYLHGHEVGGTNPSLLESLGSTQLNLLLNVGFNKEVAENTALYWNKEEGNLAQLIDRTDHMSLNEINEMSIKSKFRIKEAYSWKFIANKYEKTFLRINSDAFKKC